MAETKIKEINLTIDRKTFSSKFHEAERKLRRNYKLLGHAHRRVLVCGGGYPGIWIEHNQDNLFIVDSAPDEAWNAMKIFLETQREDGLIAFAVIKDEAHPFGRVRFSQLQQVFPFVRCAVEIADRTSRPEQDYEAVYQAGSRFDNWLVKHRNIRETGLVEMFCTYDTGHDNSPRVQEAGIPLVCPGNDAGNLESSRLLPILSCDLSAMRYGALESLENLARRLGRDHEAEQWQEKRLLLRENIMRWLYDPEDEFFYDVLPDGSFRKFRTEHITRFFLNHVVSQKEFDAVYSRYFETDGKEFRPAFPIPSVSIDDSSFDWKMPHNSWGCNSQALTMLRALFWMKDYHREADLELFLGRWAETTVQNNTLFQQELNPFDGTAIIGSRDYTPTLLLLLEYGKLHPELLNNTPGT